MSNNPLNDDDISLLEQQTLVTLAQWWGLLNSGKIPLKFLDKEPATTPAAERRLWAIMVWIMKKIGYKECLREWNKDELHGAEFDRWYDKAMTEAVTLPE